MSNKNIQLYFITQRLGYHHRGGDIDMDIGSDGNISGLWLNGYDFSENGEVVEAIVKLIGPELIQRLSSEIASQTKET